MVKVVLTANLQKYYPEREFQSSASTILAILQEMDQTRPLFSTYILDEAKNVRQHVNLFLNGQMLPKSQAGTAVKSGDTVHIMQALSGG